MLANVRRWFAKEPRKELEEVLGNQQIPSFQQAVLTVLKTLRDPRSTPRTIGDAICADPGLAVKVLRLVNSPASGLKRRVDNVGHAATLLGRSELETIVLGVAVKGVMPRSRSQGDFWRMAARRAATARALAERVDPARAPLCFAGGLLQDLAIPLLSNAKPDYAELLAAAQGSEELAVLEQEQYGWNHAQVAGWLCEAWGFPENLRTSIEGHHGADSAPIAVQVVALVDAHTDEDPAPLVEAARDRYNLRPELVIGALARGREHGDALASVLLS